MLKSNLQAVFTGHKAAVVALNLELGFHHTQAIVYGRCLNDSALNATARAEIIQSNKIHAGQEKNGGPHTRLLAEITK